MYIIISIFAFYALGIISYELSFFNWLFIALFAMFIYNSLVTKRFLYNIVILVFLLLSFINCNYNSIFILKQYINEEVEIVAEIKRQNKINPDSEYISYNSNVISINNGILKEDENTIIYVAKTYAVRENSVVKFNGNVVESSLSKNKMLFNYDNYLRSKKVGAVIFANESLNVLKEDYSYFNELSVKFRKYTENTFYNSLNKRNADIILSVILGDVDYLDENLYDSIKLMGLAHIFAVSGSHIVLMYGVVLSTLKFFCLSRRISWIIAWVLIWFYGFLIGFPLSVMRTLVMFTLLFGAEVFYRKYSSLNAIGLAALILTLYNPYWLFDAGFLLSFSAALSLIIYNKYIVKNLITNNQVLRTIYLYLFLQLFTLPVIAYFFNYVPVMGILYNLLLLPIFTIILIYGFILLILNGFLPSLLIIPFKIFDFILYSLRYIITLSERVAFNGVTVPAMNYGIIIFFYILIFLIIYFYNHQNSRITKYAFSALISFCIINYIALPSLDNRLYFNIADASQGLFVLSKYKNTSFIFDCGSLSKGFGEHTAVPYMIKRGLKNVEGVFISHWDEDHYSGLANLLENNINIAKIFSSYNSDEFDNVYMLKKGKKLKVDDYLTIEVLWPEKNYIPNSTNNGSLVLEIVYNNKTILLTGDIEQEAEDMLINNIKKTDILLVPHHGSKSSSTEGFVEKVSPEIAVLSYGKNNYGIPSEDVIRRYENRNSLILSTFDEGEINFILKGDKIYYNTYNNNKSDNYYELYFTGIISNLINFCLLVCWIINKGEYYELQINNRYD